ncbi:DUF4123 domain-containing protein [Massilia sp. SR12]
MLIDTFTADWLQALDAAYRTRPEGTFIHLLIDGAFRPGHHNSVATNEVHMLFAGLPGFNEATRDVSPFVVAYAPGDHKLRAMLTACSGWPMVSAITTTESAKELAKRLTAWCVVEVDGQYLNFRFPDTRRLPDIFIILNAEQSSEFAGTAMEWRYIGRAGEWVTVTLTPSQCAPSVDPKLESEQFSALVARGDVDVMLARAASIGCQPKAPLKSTQYAITETAMAIAIKNQLQDDALFWCNWCLEAASVADSKTLEELFVMWAAEELALAQEGIEE